MESAGVETGNTGNTEDPRDVCSVDSFFEYNLKGFQEGRSRLAEKLLFCDPYLLLLPCLFFALHYGPKFGLKSLLWEKCVIAFRTSCVSDCCSVRVLHC